MFYVIYFKYFVWLVEFSLKLAPVNDYYNDKFYNKKNIVHKH